MFHVKHLERGDNIFLFFKNIELLLDYALWYNPTKYESMFSSYLYPKAVENQLRLLKGGYYLDTETYNIYSYDLRLVFPILRSESYENK